MVVGRAGALLDCLDRRLPGANLHWAIRRDAISGATPEENADVLFKILTGYCVETDPKMEIVLVNSAAGILLGGKAEDFKGGMEAARKSIASGAAYKKLKMLIKASGGDLSRLEELEHKYV